MYVSLDEALSFVSSFIEKYQVGQGKDLHLDLLLELFEHISIILARFLYVAVTYS